MSPFWGYVLVGAFLAFVLMYLDTKLLDHPKEKSDYLLGMLMTGIIVAAILYFLGEEALKGRSNQILSSGLGYIPAIQEEILVGAPNF